MVSPILWQNSTATVTLIDIPQSIASAQETALLPFPYHLLSTAPLSQAFPSTEPKSAKAKAKLRDGSELGLKDEAIHCRYRIVIKQALDEIKSEYTGSWCLPRPFVEDAPRSGKRRRLSDDDSHPPLPGAEDVASTTAALPSDMLTNLARDGLDMTVTIHPTLSNQSQKSATNTIKNLHFITNPNSTHPSALKLTVVTASETFSNYNFHIPPNSTFSLSDCTDSLSFRKHLQTHAITETHRDGRKSFDFILLDPPWPNRSVRRSHKTPGGSSYSIASTIQDIRDMLLDVNVDRLMSDDCLVGIWITNKAAIREVVLGESGLFDVWNVHLEEEWLWLKTTMSGEPILPCDGAMRKPYEVFLLGRRRRRAGDTGPPPQEAEYPKRRVIFAVPDLHSRKPCLKQLIEPLMPDRKDYRALEIFARYLVAGWCSWGDECIKFNWEGCWRKNAEL